MRVSTGALITLSLFSAAGLHAQELREDSFKWFVGAQGGVLLFETQTQTRSTIPSGGMHVLVIAKRAGLQISVDEAFGSKEKSAFGDSNAPNGTQDVTFDRLRKYTATAMGFPLKNSKVDPFLGVGLGILHTVGTEVVGTFTTPQAAAVAQERAVQAGSTGFISFLGGRPVQGVTPLGDLRTVSDHQLPGRRQAAGRAYPCHHRRDPVQPRGRQGRAARRRLLSQKPERPPGRSGDSYPRSDADLIVRDGSALPDDGV